MTGALPRAAGRVAPAVRLVASGVCFGLAGLLWSQPRLRARRQVRVRGCRVCAGHQRIRDVTLLALAALLVAGSLARLQVALAPQIRCHSHIAPDGTVRPEPMLEISPPAPWALSRSVLVAPISGVGVLAGWALGMESCSGPPLLVMFWLPPRTSGGGSTLGDVFVAWMPPRGATHGTLSIDGYGITDEYRYLRYGPNISQERVNEAELGRHESRHVDQWAVSTLLAGPFAFPIAYFVDGTFFPGSRNHFERDAGLSLGGYPPADGSGPAPLWPEACGVLVLGLAFARRRLRWAVRALSGGAKQLGAHSPDRCPVHTRGWRPLAPR